MRCVFWRSAVLISKALLLLWGVIVAEKRDVECCCSVPNWFYSVHLIRLLSSLIFLSAVSIHLLKHSYGGVAITLPEICISSRTDNKCNFLQEVLCFLFVVCFPPMLQLALIHTGGGILKLCSEVAAAAISFLKKCQITEVNSPRS